MTAFDVAGWFLTQIVLAKGTGLDSMDNDLIGRADLIQRGAFVTCLCSWLLAARLAQAFRLRLPGKAIGGGGQMAIMAVFGQTTLQPDIHS